MTVREPMAEPLERADELAAIDALLAGADAGHGGLALVERVVVLIGFACTIWLALRALLRVDEAWIALRHRAGRAPREGVLRRVVIFSGTLGMIGFYVSYYLLSDAFILPFMPVH